MLVIILITLHYSIYIMKYSVDWIDVDNIHEDPSNPNAMNENEFNALIEEISKYGIIEPIVTRICTCEAIAQEHRCIIGGEHRYKAAKYLGIKEVPCINLNVDNIQAKMLMINLNRIRGEMIPFKLANLIVDMSKSIPVDELCKGLHVSKDEVEDMLRQRVIEKNSAKKINNRMKINNKRHSTDENIQTTVKLLSFMLTKAQYEEVVSVLESIAEEYSCTRGEALIILCKMFRDKN